VASSTGVSVSSASTDGSVSLVRIVDGDERTDEPT